MTPNFPRPGRLIQEQLIDSAIAGWTSANTSEAVIETLERADVPVGPIYNIQDCANDPIIRREDCLRPFERPVAF